LTFTIAGAAKTRNLPKATACFWGDSRFCGNDGCGKCSILNFPVFSFYCLKNAGFLRKTFFIYTYCSIIKRKIVTLQPEKKNS
jgi:hypothetical protein